MIIPIEYWIDRVLKKLYEPNYKVVVQCATDVDSICCATMFTIIFENFCYTLNSIQSRNELIESTQQYLSINNTIIIFVNCGGKENMNELFRDLLIAEKGNEIYILDCHRPLHHENLLRKKIFVVGKIDYSILEKLQTYRSDEEEEEENEKLLMGEENDEDEEKESRRDSSILQKHLEKMKDEEDEEDDEMKGFIVDDDEEDDFRKGSKDVLESYYYPWNYQYDDPSSYFVLMGANLNNYAFESQKLFLWLCSVSLTEFYLFRRIKPDDYQRVYRKLKDLIMNNLVRQRKNNVEGISIIETEIKFFLYRHWNLYDSMLHSSVVIKFFQMWNKKAKLYFQQKMAELGISETELKRNYNDMDFDIRESFLKYVRNEMELEEEEFMNDEEDDEDDEELDDDDDDEYLPFGVSEEKKKKKKKKIRKKRRRIKKRRKRNNIFASFSGLLYSSFSNKISNSLEVSSSDIAYCILSHMEFSFNINKAIMDLQSSASMNVKEIKKRRFRKIIKMLMKPKSAGIKQKNIMEVGLKRAVSVKKEIVTFFYFVINQNKIVRKKPFSYLHVESHDQIFETIVALNILAFMVMDVKGIDNLIISKNIKNKEGETKRAFIMAVERERRNIFSDLFRRSSESENIQLETEFDATVVRINAQDIKNFIERLTFLANDLESDGNN